MKDIADTKEAFAQQLKIDLGNLNNELMRQPGLFSRWAVVAVEARAERDRLEEVLKVIDAKLEDKIRKEDAEKGSKYKITASEILSKIFQDFRHTRAVEEYLKAKKDADIIWEGARTAFLGRKDCLISLAANFREERDSDLHIKEKKAEEIIRKRKEEK